MNKQLFSRQDAKTQRTAKQDADPVPSPVRFTQNAVRAGTAPGGPARTLLYFLAGGATVIRSLLRSKIFCPTPFTLEDVLYRGKRSVLVTVVDDALGHHRPDAIEGP